MSMERDNVPEQEQEQYSFLQETIKDDTFDRKKLLCKVSKLVGKGLVFGIAASVGFFALKPWVETTFKKDPNQVTIPKDEELIDHTEEEGLKNPVQTALTIENHKELTEALRQVAVEANKSMVEVVGVHENPEWTMPNPDEHSGAGLIVADNGPELLILTNASILKDAQAIKVKFVDGVQYNAVIKKKDSNIDMAILSISKSSIKETTWSKIKVAQLGNSNALLQGDTLLALGEPFSYAKGLGIGIASSLKHNAILADGEYNILVTDMAGTERSSGALFDVDGKVVGIIHPDFFAGEDRGVLTAFGISSIKNEIELMSNGKDVPYIGIKGTMVTKEISEANHIPEGLFVIEVEAGSPAMNAGIQAGDIITDIGERKVESPTAYHNSVAAQEVASQLTLKGQRRGAEEYVEIGYTVIVGIKE